MTQKPTYEVLELQIAGLQEKSEERFRQLLKNSFDIIVLIDVNGVQKFVSESCEKILGYRPEELVNISVIDTMIHPEDREKTYQGLMNILENKGHGGTQYRHRHKNGGWVYLETFGTNQLDNPAVQAVVLNIRDVTESRRIMKKLQENQKRLSELNAAKDKFFSIIAHDLKGPFNSIIGFSELLEEQIKNKNYEGIEKYAEVIHHSSQKALNLLTNLLAWASVQTGRIQFQPEFFDLNRVLNEVFELIADQASQKSVSVISELTDSLQVFADKKMMATILRNLVSNGVKFTQEGGMVLVDARIESHQLLVSVRDTGIGIPKENINKLFRIDENLSTAGTKKEKGTGLGLLLCKEFLEMHGGEIKVESVPDKGSVFSFWLPVPAH